MTSPHIGNIILVTDTHDRVLLGLKKPKQKSDDTRKRKRVGIGRWVPPGGAHEPEDKSPVHAAQRELLEETGLRFPISAFKKTGELRGFLNGSGEPTWHAHIYQVLCLRPQLVHFNQDEYDDMQWFLVSELPYKKMIAGDRTWLPRMVVGEKLSVEIHSDADVLKARRVKVEKYTGK